MREEHLSYDSYGKVLQSVYYAYDNGTNTHALTSQIIVDGTTGNDLRYLFTSQEYNVGTGLYNYGGRELDPGVAKFLQEDPIVWVGGLWSLGVYVGNDPVNRTDPTGMREAPAIAPPATPPVSSPAVPNNIPQHHINPSSKPVTGTSPKPNGITRGTISPSAAAAASTAVQAREIANLAIGGRNAEIAQALAQHVRDGNLTPEEAKELFKQLANLPTSNKGIVGEDQDHIPYATNGTNNRPHIDAEVNERVYKYRANASSGVGDSALVDPAVIDNAPGYNQSEAYELHQRLTRSYSDADTQRQARKCNDRLDLRIHFGIYSRLPTIAGRQRHHLNQFKAFGSDTVESAKTDGTIPKNLGFAVSLSDKQHRALHEMLESFWSRYRKGGIFEKDEKPTIAQYHAAHRQAMLDAGICKHHADMLTTLAMFETTIWGMKATDRVPRIPGAFNPQVINP